jgi:hypothetical protein
MKKEPSGNEKVMLIASRPKSNAAINGFTILCSLIHTLLIFNKPTHENYP